MDERLAKYCHLVEVRSFTKAAQDLHISQPALSIALRNLEHDLGVRLIERGGKQFKLTAAGLLTYQAAKDIDAQSHKLKQKLAALGRQKPSVTVGMIDSMADILFSQSNAFEKLDAMAHVSLTVDNSSRLILGVGNNRLDLAITTSQIDPLPESIATKLVAKEPLVLVSHTDLAAENTKCIKRGKLTSFVSYDQSSTTDRLVQMALAEKGLEVEPIFRSTSPDIMLKLVLARKGRAVLPFVLVQPYLRTGDLVTLKTTKGCLVDRPISAIYRQSSDITKPLQYVIDSLQKLLNELNTQVKDL